MRTLKLNYRTIMAITAAVFASFIFIGSVTAGNNESTPSKNIVQIAVEDARFSTLVDALVKAELVDALNTDGPFTVFAPTNEAFDELFTSLGISGIDDLTKEQLTPILLYHVVSGEVMAKDVTTGEVPTLNTDADISVKVWKKGVTINGESNVIITDVMGTNGVIHVIDKVLVPGS